MSIAIDMMKHTPHERQKYLFGEMNCEEENPLFDDEKLFEYRVLLGKLLADSADRDPLSHCYDKSSLKSAK